MVIRSRSKSFRTPSGRCSSATTSTASPSSAAASELGLSSRGRAGFHARAIGYVTPQPQAGPLRVSRCAVCANGSRTTERPRDAMPIAPSPTIRLPRLAGRAADRAGESGRVHRTVCVRTARARARPRSRPGRGDRAGSPLGRAAAASDPRSFLALQAGIYRYGETVDLAAKLVDKVGTDLRTVLQGQQ